MAKSVDDDVDELMSRPLGGLRVPYVCLDAICVLSTGREQKGVVPLFRTSP